MSLPSDQQRALDQIEKTLADDHPSLGPLFAVFTRLTGHEAMPVTERITARPRWRQLRMRSAVVAVVGLAMATGALLALKGPFHFMPRNQVPEGQVSRLLREGRCTWR